jgi:hypothetical protein
LADGVRTSISECVDDEFVILVSEFIPISSPMRSSVYRLA